MLMWMENWRTKSHLTAMGFPCPNPYWILWGGIGATCKCCARVEIDGELSGYGAHMVDTLSATQ